MATELITRVWCDVHMIEKDEQVAATSFAYAGREVDLCPECSAPFVQVAGIVGEYGRKQGAASVTKPGRRSPGSGRRPVVPEGEEGETCPDCGKVYASHKRMREHHRRAHREEIPGPPFVCPEPGCGRVFRTPQGLGGHRRAHA